MAGGNFGIALDGCALTSNPQTPALPHITEPHADSPDLRTWNMVGEVALKLDLRSNITRHCRKSKEEFICDTSALARKS